MHKVAETKLETCQGGFQKSNGNLSWAQVKSAHGKRRSQWTNSARSEWLGWAEVWNELADDAIGHPLEERIANRSSDLAESNYEKVE